MNKKTLMIGALAITLSSTSLLADSYRDYNRGQRDYARVIDVTPIVQQVDVSTPRRECWEELVTRRDRVSRHHSAAPTLLGGLIGGAIGHNIGHGKARGLATVAGTLIGASVGAESAWADDDHGYYTASEQRCRVTTEHVSERRTVGYNVTYKYRGETYTTRMDQDPGKRIPVEVSVRPVH